MLGARIAVLRHSRGLSQAQMARNLGISPSAMGMYEQGRREPPLELVVAMARFYGVSTDYLLTGNPTPGEAEGLKSVLEQHLDSLDRHLKSRRDKPFTRQELSVLLTAMLLER